MACLLTARFSVAGFCCLLLIGGLRCIHHPLMGTEQLATYLGQSTDEDDELDGELLSILAVAGGGLLADAGGGAPTVATEITMYTNGRGGGALGGIAGANALCDASGNKPAGTTGVAFLSSDGQDLVTLSGVPASLPVVGPNATVISTNWAGLFDGGGIDATLFAAGVLAVATDEFFSGTDNTGTNVSGSNCSNWTAAAADSAVGRGNLTTGSWLDQNDPTNQCSGANHLLCVAW